MSFIFNDPNAYIASSSISNYGDALFNTTSSNGTSTTYSTSTLVSNVEIKLKKCRVCFHAHVQGQEGCFDTVGYSVCFVPCDCQEYVPSDNLEYMTYLFNKSQKEK